jgi:hypothetical protein
VLCILDKATLRLGDNDFALRNSKRSYSSPTLLAGDLNFDASSASRDRAWIIPPSVFNRLGSGRVEKGTYGRYA